MKTKSFAIFMVSTLLFTTSCTQQIKQTKNQKQPAIGGIESSSFQNSDVKNIKITAITAAMCTGTGLELFREKLSDRFFDVSIAEQHGLTFAAGQAKSGYHPFISIYSTFMQRGVDQVIHDICMQNLPVTMILDRAGLVGEDGETHHGVFDISLFGAIPNLVYMEPKDGAELKKMMKFSTVYNGPTMIRFPKASTTDDNNGIIELENVGDFELYTDQNKGSDFKLAIIGLGSEFTVVSNIADKLRAKGFAIDVYNPRFISPISKDTLLNLEKYQKVFTLENHVVIGGFGSLLKSRLLNPKVYSFGLPNSFIEHGSISELRKEIGFTQDNILKEIERIISE